MDATRVSDGKVVAIKQVSALSREIEIGEMLSTRESLQDPLNHCVPFLDHFSSPEEPNIVYIVMPLLRPFDNPEFYDISEILDFMSQTLEVRGRISSKLLSPNLSHQGLIYLHRRSVAHRYASALCNIF